jgi:hypothetical protein
VELAQRKERKKKGKKEREKEEGKREGQNKMSKIICFDTISWNLIAPTDSRSELGS